MKTTVFFIIIVGVASILNGSIDAQEGKPVPKDSMRVFIPGCSKGLMFTAGRRTEDRPGSSVPEGMHLRMSGPKSVMAEIKKQEGSTIEITGLIKRGQFAQDGVGIGGVRITPSPSPSGGNVLASPGAGQVMIDVEGWRSIQGSCPSR